MTQGDWHSLLEPAVREDLRKHRSYRGRSVRDLLRAIRNKKHHYRELTEEAKALYGEMPGEFADYWTSRFPRLVMHSYKAMQCCKYDHCIGFNQITLTFTTFCSGWNQTLRNITTRTLTLSR